MNDNLPDLRDIHLPTEGISIWPLAYGWWVILLSTISIFLLLWLFLLLHRKSKKRYALKLISSLCENNCDSITKMSEVLRRICIYKYPSAASLFGQQWIDFLNSHSSQKITSSLSQILINSPYADPTSSVISPSEIAEIRDFCTSWIGENL